ncbi:hypothetical protein C8N30_2561 [Sulfitobacter guttiformis]|uniref:Uncharacterized protein n=1 Tax=Sulfitobacter guttiformis TaxID=74349 RepID=A0A420DUI8_9RHOB|nr:hypothetical protein C8N30_2561 [Sulfitobacter guttiformis]
MGQFSVTYNTMRPKLLIAILSVIYKPSSFGSENILLYRLPFGLGRRSEKPLFRVVYGSSSASHGGFAPARETVTAATMAP